MSNKGLLILIIVILVGILAGLVVGVNKSSSAHDLSFSITEIGDEIDNDTDSM